MDRWQGGEELEGGCGVGRGAVGRKGVCVCMCVCVWTGLRQEEEQQIKIFSGRKLQNSFPVKFNSLLFFLF